jgi:hypothetical protein
MVIYFLLRRSVLYVVLHEISLKQLLTKSRPLPSIGNCKLM